MAKPERSPLSSRVLSSAQLQAFQAMMLCRNMTEAADRLGISEAAVSKCKAALEQELGVQLFTRVSGRLVPTQEAKTLLPYVQRAVNSIEAAKSAAAALRQTSFSRLNIVCAGPAMFHPVPAAIKRISESFPDAQVHVDIDSLRGVLEKVAYNIADVGVAPAGGREVDPRVLGMCDLEVLSRDALVVVLPKGHRLARASIVRPEDLAGETLVSLDSTSTTAEMISAVLFQSGVSFRRSVTAANGVGICTLVAAGVGVGFLNPNFFHSSIEWNVVRRPFSPRIELRTCIYRSKLSSSTPIVDRFAEELKRALTDFGQTAARG